MRKGFTLIELIVVVLIMGILASMGMPYYFKTVETSKATNSIALAHMIGNANRMYKLDNPAAYMSGPVSNSCNPPLTCTGATGACRLVACNYVAPQDWGSGSYDYFACNGTTGASCCATAAAVSCTRRKAGASAPYSGWGYWFSEVGACFPIGSAPACPTF